MRPQIVPSGGASQPPLPLGAARRDPSARPAPPRRRQVRCILPRRYPSAGGGSFRTAPLRHRGSAPPAPLSPARPGAPRRRHGPDPAHPLPGAPPGGRGGGRAAASHRRGGAARGRCRGSRAGPARGVSVRAPWGGGRPGALGGGVPPAAVRGSGSVSRRAPPGKGQAGPGRAVPPLPVPRRGGRGWRGARAVRAGPAASSALLPEQRHGEIPARHREG